MRNRRQAPGQSYAFASVTGLALLLSAAGCWEEIRYAGPATADALPEEAPPARPSDPTSTTPTEEPGPVEPATEPTTDPATEPSGEDLFGGSSDTSGAPAASIEPPAEVAEQTPRDVPPQASTSDGGSSDTLTSGTAARAPITASDRLHAWTMGSSWSLAAALQAKGVDSSRYQSYLNEAEQAAGSLGVDLPSLPTAGGGDDRQSAVIAALQTGVGADVVATVARRLDAAAGGAVDLAIQAHALLLAYTPTSVETSEFAASIRAAGQASELPANLWQPLVELVERGAAFDDVKSAVFALQQDVADHLTAKPDE